MNFSIIKRIPVLIAALAVFASSALSAREGLYVKVEAGRSDVDTFGLDDSSEVFGADMGWRFTENYGAELGFRQLGDYRARSGNASNLDAKLLSAALSGRFELNPEADQGFFVEGRVGLGNYRVDGLEQAGSRNTVINDSGTRPFYGLGAGYNFSRNFSLAFNYSAYRGRREPVGGLGKLEIDFTTLALAAEYRY